MTETSVTVLKYIIDNPDRPLTDDLFSSYVVDSNEDCDTWYTPAQVREELWQLVDYYTKTR